MPVKKVKSNCYKWGAEGKVYCGVSAKSKARKQGVAILLSKKRKNIKIKSHRRKVKGKTVRVKTHKRNVKRSKKVGIVTRRERKIFDEMTTDKDLNNIEFGGYMDFERKKNGKIYLENFSTAIGDSEEIFIPAPKDKEIFWHSHPKGDWTVLSIGDLEGILKNKNQQGEVLFHNGEALLVMKPKSLKTKSFLKEYDLLIHTLLFNQASEKEAKKHTYALLRKYGFEVSLVKKRKPLRIKVERVH